jgi:hypothetical protein
LETEAKTDDASSRLGDKITMFTLATAGIILGLFNNALSTACYIY